ncbi:MAG: hypothetical protein GY772_16015, partial [bacterium]|nr:hypothetical protein [bacterium]
MPDVGDWVELEETTTFSGGAPKADSEVAAAAAPTVVREAAAAAAAAAAETEMEVEAEVRSPKLMVDVSCGQSDAGGSERPAKAANKVKVEAAFRAAEPPPPASLGSDDAGSTMGGGDDDTRSWLCVHLPTVTRVTSATGGSGGDTRPGVDPPAAPQLTAAALLPPPAATASGTEPPPAEAIQGGEALPAAAAAGAPAAAAGPRFRISTVKNNFVYSLSRFRLNNKPVY